MKFIHKQKISVKIALLYSFLFSIILFILSTLILFGVRYYIHTNGKNQFEKAEVEVLNSLNSSDKLNTLALDYEISINLYDADLNLIFSTNPRIPNIHIDTPFNESIYKEINDNHIIYKNLKLSNDDYGFVQLYKNLNSEYIYLKILFFILCVIDFLGVVISIIVGFWFGKKLLNPINTITKTAENISINNLNERIETSDTDDELNRLAKTFNMMIERLQNSLDRKLQFVSDASHELRTPIAVIQGYANLLDRWGKNDEDALNKSVTAIKIEADNMSNLVENLLLLGKSDSGILRVNKSNFYLDELINDTLNEFKLLNNDVIIKTSMNDKACIFADYIMIKQLIRIFINNSIRYSDKNCIVDICCFKDNNNVSFSVADNGFGIPREDLPFIFDRFYRVDKSRCKASGGNGLGLSIAKLLIDLNDGKVNVESTETIGSKFTVTFDIF